MKEKMQQKKEIQNMDKIKEIKKINTELKEWIDEKIYQYLSNGYTKEQASKEILDEIKLNMWHMEWRRELV